MTNKDLAAAFDLLAKLMELHRENQFKIRSYRTVSDLLSKMGSPAADMSQEELLQLKGVGKAIADKIKQLVETGKMKTLERYRDQTPPGIQELLTIKGIGVSKVRSVWQELEVESPAELRYACVENRLIDLKGFGVKTQQDILEKLDFHFTHREEVLLHRAVSLAEDILDMLESFSSTGKVSHTGALRRKLPVVTTLDFIVEAEADILQVDLQAHDAFSEVSKRGQDISCRVDSGHQCRLFCTPPQTLGSRLFMTTGPSTFTSGFEVADVHDEATIFAQNSRDFVPAHVREIPEVSSVALDRLITLDDVKGVLHVHSNYSDGVDSIEAIAEHARGLGYHYLGITDHSQIAVYANGVGVDRLEKQWAEIEALNATYQDFTILKGIECDILNDGDLDYSAEVRRGFDFVIASIHTNVKMDRSKATARLIKAIENPDTNIIGHPTGRLLLGRSGYPLDMVKVFDACEANKVALELNVSPSRMDLDWEWLLPAMAKGVRIAVNPDAHAKEAIKSLEYGVQIAQKGGLTVDMCPNTLSVVDFLKFCQKR